MPRERLEAPPKTLEPAAAVAAPPTPQVRDYDNLLEFYEESRQKQKDSLDVLEDLERGLRFDRNDLDTALMEQPDFFFRVAREFAVNESRRDAAKQWAEEIKAEADQVIRSDASGRGEKISETQVLNRVLLNRSYAKANDNYFDWKQLTAKWSALKEAYTQRSYALKDMVQLYATGYYGDAVGASARSDVKDRVSAIVRERAGDMRHGPRT